MKKLLTKAKIYSPKLLLLSITLAGLFVLGPKLLSLSYGNIDPSFNYGVNNAAASHESFGEQFIATYGPLGYLVANYLPQNVIKVSAWLLFYAIALGLGVYFFVTKYVKTPKKRWYSAIILLYVLTMNVGASIEWCYLSLFILYCFILLKLSLRSQTILFGLLSFMAALFSLTKFTLGFSTLSTLVLLCLLATDPRFLTRLKKVAFVGVIYLGTFLFFGRLLGVNNPSAYVHTAIIESSNFSGAMAEYSSQTVLATIFVALAIIIMLAWPLIHGKKYFVKYLFLLPALFTIWKYSVARQDAHLLRFLQISVPLAIIIFYSWKTKSPKDLWVLFTIISLSVIAVWANNLPFYGYGNFSSFVTSPISNITTGQFIDYFQISKQKKIWADGSAGGLQGAALPASMQKRIGRDGVDVFPWETSVVAANNLVWKNRPSPFSFETYDPFLDNLNASFFASPAAPKYIVWHNTGARSIDFRNIVWDEPKTLREILSNYQIVEASKGYMLLQKKSTPIKLDQKIIELGVVEPSDKWIKIPVSKGDQLLFVNFQIKKSLIDQIGKTLVRGKVYNITMKTNSGLQYTYRFVAENSSQGLLIGNVPHDWASLTDQFRHNTDPSNTTKEFKITEQQ